MTAPVFGIIFLFVCFAVVFRLIAGGQDRSRISKYIEREDGHLIDISWTPFGPGWAGEKTDRIYYVTYRDAQNNLHHASCKTSLFSGVYFTRDTIVEQAVSTQSPEVRTPPGDDALRAELTALREENQRLREEIEKSRGPLM